MPPESVFLGEGGSLYGSGSLLENMVTRQAWYGVKHCRAQGLIQYGGKDIVQVCGDKAFGASGRCRRELCNREWTQVAEVGFYPVIPHTEVCYFDTLMT